MNFRLRLNFEPQLKGLWETTVFRIDVVDPSGQATRGIHVPKIYTPVASGACNTLYPFGKRLPGSSPNSKTQRRRCVSNRTSGWATSARVACSDV